MATEPSRRENSSAASFSAVVVAEPGDVRQYINFLSKGLVGVAAADGNFLWRYDGTINSFEANVPTPIVRGDCVFSANCYGGG
jgi:hypothetical protein